jgi:hypothetical protein
VGDDQIKATGQTPHPLRTAEGSDRPSVKPAADQVHDNEIGARVRRFWTKLNARSSGQEQPIPGEKTTILKMLLEKEKQAFFAERPDDLDAHRRRGFLQRIARVIHASPYGASLEEIRDGLRADPHIHALAPDIDLEDVGNLLLDQMDQRKQYFSAWGAEDAAFARAKELQSNLSKYGFKQVLEELTRIIEAPTPFLPNPFAPISFVDQYGHPTIDAQIDYAVISATKGQEAARQSDRYGGHKEEASRTWRLPQIAPETLALRRTLLGAPPHFSFDRIAEQHNALADYYAPFTDGPKTFTGADVRSLLENEPAVVGAEIFNEMRRAFNNTVSEGLTASKPGENLYAVLDRITVLLVRSMGPGASITPEELLHYITGDEDLATRLNAAFQLDARASIKSLYPTLSRRVAQAFGDKLTNYSLHEIVNYMKLEDPSFSEGLLLDLIAECKDVFGTVPLARAQRNFVLATQVAEMMHRVQWSATYDEVAKLMVSLGPLGQVPPDFSGKDIELLQGYDFVPRWPNGKKPDTAHENALLAQSRLMRELEEPLSLVSPTDARAIRVLMLKALVHPSEREIPEELHAAIEKGFSRALLKRLCPLLGLYADKSWAERSAEYASFLRFLDGDESLNRDQLFEILNRVMPWDKSIPYADTAATLFDKASRWKIRELLRDQSWRSSRGVVTKTVENAGEIATLLSAYRSCAREVELSIENQGFKNEKTRKELQRFSMIPLALPVTRQVVENVKQEARAEKKGLPFENARVVMIQHELGQAFGQVNAFRDLGMDPAKCTFVGVPYHPNSEVEEALIRSIGVRGRFCAQGDLATLHKNIEQAVDEAIVKRQPGEKVLIVCDGPYARRYFEEKYLSRDPSLAKIVRFTEQTARGDRPQDRANDRMRVVSYARHPQKVREAKYIGRAAARAIGQVMHALKDTIENKPVLVKALGPIGMAGAESLKALGARVLVWDKKITPEMRDWAREAKIEIVEDPDKAEEWVHMIVGAAGETSIGAKTIDAGQRTQYYVSLSSELLEMDIGHIEKRATGPDGEVHKALATMVNNQPTYFYQLDDGSIRVVVAGGLPVNFNDINSLPPEIVDFTMALSVSAAVEAMEDDALGYRTLTRNSKMIYDAYGAYLESYLERAEKLEALTAPPGPPEAR